MGQDNSDFTLGECENLPMARPLYVLKASQVILMYTSQGLRTTGGGKCKLQKEGF